MTFTNNSQILQFNFTLEFFLNHDIDKKSNGVYRQRDRPFVLEF